MNAQEIVRIIAGERVPVFLSAIAGITDPLYSLKAAKSGYTAGVSIGGYDIDTATHNASLEISKRRKEFTVRPETLFDHIKPGLLAILSHTSCLINLRAVDGDYLSDFCQKIKKITLDTPWQPVIELNVHCVQPEMLEIGAGLGLARNWKRIAELVKIVKNYGLLVGMKYKIVHSPEIPFDGKLFIKFLTFVKGYGLDILHLDSYQKGKPGNYLLPLFVAAENVPEMMVVGNNSVLNAVDGQKILSAGAHGFSIARGYLKDGLIFQKIVKDFSLSNRVFNP